MSKTQPKSHAPYSAEFRAEAVRLARVSEKPKIEMARELGMSIETVRQWIRQAAIDAGQRHDGLTSEERDELRRLRKEVRRLRKEVRILREEREILVQAAAFFAKGTSSMR
jgi:transposase